MQRFVHPHIPAGDLYLFSMLYGVQKFPGGDGIPPHHFDLVDKRTGDP